MDDPRPSDADVAAAHHELMVAYAASPMSGQPATGSPSPPSPRRRLRSWWASLRLHRSSSPGSGSRFR